MNYKPSYKFISWNVRGVNEKEKRLAIRQTIILENPDMVCLQETKIADMSDRMAKELCGRKLDQFATRDAEGTRGGIFIAWTTRKFSLISTTIRTYSLSLLFKNLEDSSTFLYTGVYGPSVRINRPSFFEELKDLKPVNSIPWILNGDFNVTMRNEERNNPTSDWRGTLTFARLVSELELLNITLQGRKFTWSNEREDPSMAKLDRFLISEEWNNKFPNSQQQSLANTSSDHCPILYTAQTQFQKTNLFRFENCWLQFPELDEVVAKLWEQEGEANTPTQLNHKLQALQKEIKIWAAARVGSIKAQIKVCREFIGWLDKAKETRSVTLLEKFIACQIKKRYTDLSILEEDIWKQRAKLRWELKGDKNTRYFHTVASTSKRKNTIMHIEWNGQQFSDQRAKADAFFQFYKELMGKSSASTPTICWDNLYGEERHELQALQDPIMVQEVQQVIQTWPRNKSPGPDGFTGEFYTKYQNILIRDIHAVLSHITTTGDSLHPLNTSHIILIPKKETSLHPQDYRPISLIHGMQRIFSKILANRVQQYIPRLVSEEQTGFIKNRQIAEGFIYAQHALHNSQQNKIPLAIFKADVHKAFDTISWEYLIKVLKNLNFPSNWLLWIENSVLKGTSQILINGLLGKKITLKRGVRQGDPLSPFLFIIAMDFINRWVSKLKATGAIRLPYPGMSPCLLYADDTLFFLKPDLRQVQILKIVLTAFESISGLAVNMNKSELVTTITSQETGTELALAMGCKLGEFPMKYLGLPLSNKKLNKTAYLPLIQKFSNRLEGWAARNLSIAGRLILLNAVLSALPTYYMSCLKLPVWVIKEIDRIRRHFLWHGATQERKKLNLANWELVCKPKKLGGLGVMDLTVFNNAMLAKWYWQWTNPEKRLWKTIFQQTNQTLWPVPKSKFFNITLKDVYSFMDTSIMRIVGKGDSILFWGHNWGIGILKHEFKILYSYAIDQNQSIAQMSGARNIRELFRGVLSEEAEQELTQLIQNLHQQTIMLTSNPDEARWKWTPSSQFSVSSYYHAFIHAPTIRSQVHKIWKIKAPPRMQVFSWLMMQNKVLTIDNLMKRGWTMVNRCIMCRNQLESVIHLFEECTVTIEIYRKLALTMGMKLPTRHARKALITNEINKEERSLLLIAQFVVWRERCSRIFTDKSIQTETLIQQVRDQWMITMKTNSHTA